MTFMTNSSFGNVQEHVAETWFRCKFWQRARACCRNLVSATCNARCRSGVSATCIARCRNWLLKPSFNNVQEHVVETLLKRSFGNVLLHVVETWFQQP
ncbi:Hypothetical predicted protein, partial [Olea europaea subsp. europaea]